MPVNSGIVAVLICGIWYFYFYGANLTSPIFGMFSFDSSELPIITTYALYIPMFVVFMIKEGKGHVFKNIVMPLLAVLSSLFMIFVAVYAHGIRPHQQAAERGEFAFPVLFYLIVFAVIMALGAVFYKKRKKAEFE
jgi:APA family basic amino acid/polyamine antiporter